MFASHQDWGVGIAAPELIPNFLHPRGRRQNSFAGLIMASKVRFLLYALTFDASIILNAIDESSSFPFFGVTEAVIITQWSYAFLVGFYSARQASVAAER